jgi:hypothetical protein
MHVRRTNNQQPTANNQQPTAASSLPIVIQPWPNGAKAAVSFSFDWETAMGGLIHSRSLDDPNADADPLDRAMRMRQGVTTTLELFRPYEIQATYYANGYNFLLGNAEKRLFMGDPTFAWASEENGWNNVWSTQPWFSNDPYTSVQDSPAWYFGDLVPLLLAEKQDIQSHTFSHFSGSFASTAEWQADLQAWRDLAGERGVKPATSLAFPWSSSAGMSDTNWQELAKAGITSVTRTNWSQRQSRFVDRQTPRCVPVPGHESILGCPDFYLVEEQSASPNSKLVQMSAGGGPDLAIAQIGRAMEVGGMIDIWAHTEEVVSADEREAWGRVVRYAAEQRDAGRVWIAPLAEIAGWQHALNMVSIQQSQAGNQDEQKTFLISNNSTIDLNGLTLKLPVNIGRITIDGVEPSLVSGENILVNVPAKGRVEVTLWPA